MEFRGLAVAIVALFALGAVVTVWCLEGSLRSEALERHEKVPLTDEELHGVFVGDRSRLDLFPDGGCREEFGPDPVPECANGTGALDREGEWTRTAPGLSVTFADRHYELATGRLGGRPVLTGEGQLWRQLPVPSSRKP